ncbi:MAG: bifunctional diaminohydroxyphosphoribosylaminopyrimidine deaminase/5-amino-6-(5-phosphoribosylamino)uracil reductase RibD [Rhodobacteraceae bacterium]|nr:bifunctional diaminohydroxyphosphoribosylaminopyrimidine deaminase/5-amino-6-(5-phosphoribosylamino)uracil reductase RibD [Paracoccaceae bacterium]
MPNSDSRWMQLALSLGARGLGRVWPNPAVGCVIVRENHLIGRGWTQPGGRPHAETMALAQAKDAKGATAYITLEPCAHTGKTPPCATALIKAGISRVVCPIKDPDPRVSGKGFAMLRAAGIKVDTGLMASKARQANAGFLLGKESARPFITLKLAASLDGRIATATGESRWITGAQARAYVHLLRANHDAVLIGSGTARTDNPMLDIRGLGLTSANPVRVVLDSGLSLPPESRLALSARDIPLWICHTNAPQKNQQVLAALGATLIKVAPSENGVDLLATMQSLAKNGLTRILVEGGGKLAASLIKAGLVDQLEVFHAGLLLGAGSTPALGVLCGSALDDFPRFKLLESRTLGNDTLTVWSQ